jgi:LDH2 family malate/lactate/ureidoglycolate dehydrogenase
VTEEWPERAKVVARPNQIEAFCSQVLQRLGDPPEETAITAGTQVTLNLRGVETHGVSRLPAYVAKLKGGALKPAVTLTMEKETITTAFHDGHDGIGQVISYRAMKMAIRKAKTAGISCVAVKHSNLLGACAYYSRMALEHDMIGCTATNASPRLAPTGSVERMFGNNPWSIAVPAGGAGYGQQRRDGREDSHVPRAGRPIPEGWALDAKGAPTMDPAEALKGILLAIDGYKGYGIISSKKAEGFEVIYLPGEP